MPEPRVIEADAPQLPAVRDEASAAKRRGQDARNVSRGTSRRIKHGIYAESEPSVRREIIDEAAILFARCGWLDEVRDGPMVEATARIITRLRRLDAIVDAGETGQVLTSMLSRLEGQLTRNLTALGMTPAASASLGLAHLDGRAKAFEAAQKEQARYAPKRKRAPR
ncbi:MAG: hypothetical protein H0U86_15075 [Chloroflexi bacterium]|nr:hypothetical protein [Chloroflexota bacterium]